MRFVDEPLKLQEVCRSDAHLITALLDDYLRELAAHREFPVGATNAANYPYLDAYWSEPGRQIFLIRSENAVIGFAFIRKPISNESGACQVAEFYIAPAARRHGRGRRAIETIWRLFPGSWELQVHARNSNAKHFWSECIATYAVNPPRISEVQARDGRRLEFHFEVGHIPDKASEQSEGCA